MAVNMQTFEAAMQAALRGPEKKKIKIERHEFNVKPITVRREGARVIVDGKSGHHISHHRSWMPDDQIHFGFEKLPNGDTSGLEISIEAGGIGALAKKIAKIVKIALEVAAAAGVLKADGTTDADAAFQETKRLLDGTWQGEASFLIANIALRVH